MAFKYNDTLHQQLAEIGAKFEEIKKQKEEKEREIIYNDFNTVIEKLKASQDRSDELIERLEKEQMKYKKRPELN